VAFASLADDLVPGDTNRSQDVFVHDRFTGETIRLPVNGNEPLEPGGRASDPAISPDGGSVAFSYYPPADSGTSDGPIQPIVLLWEAQSGFTRLVSVDRREGPAYGSYEPAISEGGRFVAFTSINSFIAPGDRNQQTDVFRVDTQTGAATMISQTPSGTSPRGSSWSPTISADGNIVAFTSDAPNVLIPDPPPPKPTPTPAPPPSPSPSGPFLLSLPDAGESIVGGGIGPGGGEVGGQAVLLVSQVYARNVAAAATELISMTPFGAPGSGPSMDPAISADGTVIAFVSFGSDLAPGDPDSAGDIYIRERNFARTSLLTADMPDAGHIAMSGDSRFIVFASATDPANDGVEVYHRDRFDGETIHISVALRGGNGGSNNLGPVVSANGRVTAWASTSDALIADDGNEFGDVFVRDLSPAGVIDPAALDFGTRAIGTTAPPAAATLTSVGWTPLGSITATITGGDSADFGLVFDGCTGKVMPRPQSCTMTVQFSPLAVGPRSSTLLVSHDGIGSPHIVQLTGAGSNAELTLNPPNGPPGIVAIAEGKGFPPSTEIILEWTVGINEKRASPVVTDALGAFRTQVLVFHHDVEGPRDLLVSPANGTAFPPLSVSFFVSKPTSQSPRFDPASVGREPPRGFIVR
jgi:Tol biopolymer transport system component